MKQFRVIKFGNEVFSMELLDDGVIKVKSGNTDGDDYLSDSNYFRNLLQVISNVIGNVDLVLNVTEKSSLITLYLADNQIRFAEDVKKKLSDAFEDQIEQISIKGNEVNIIDDYFSVN